MKKIWLAIALIWPTAAVAETTYKPADFAFSGEQLAKSTKQSVTMNTSVLYCQSDINISGQAIRTSCFDKSGAADLVQATETALEELAFSAAEVDGKKVPVRMSYRVAYNIVGANLKVTLIPNLGSMQDRYGRDYIAPQERLDLSNWYETYNDASWVNGHAFLGEGAQSRVAATVDANGKTDVVRLLDTSRAYQRDAKIVRKALRKSRFIPGFVDGKPAPMGYLAVVHYGGEGSAVAKSK